VQVGIRGQKPWTKSVDKVRGQKPWTKSVDKVRGQNPWTKAVDKPALRHKHVQALGTRSREITKAANRYEADCATKSK
jgi:hypothetical protein